MIQIDEIPAEIQLVALREENERLRRAKAIRESNGIYFYRPHAKQHKFHTNTATGRYGRTGNRFGKSEMGIAEDIAWCMGGRVWYKETFEIKNGEGEVVESHVGSPNHPNITKGIPNHPVKGLLIVVDWDMAKRIFTNRDGGDPQTWGKLFKLLPRESIGKVSLSRAGNVEQVEIKRLREFGGGSSTLSIDTIQSYKNSKLGAESADWDFIHVDEPCPEGLFKAHARGLMDRNGHYWFTCTPLDEMWINDKFIPATRQLVESAPDGVQFDTRYIITGSIYDNPYRSPEGVAEFESSLTREEKECRLHGHPLAMAGRVYKEFIYDMHVLADLPVGWKEYWLPPKSYTVRVAWDVHGARKPQAILFVATSPTGDVFVYDELFVEPLIKPTAQAIKRKIEGYFVADQIIDPRALIVNPVTRTADILDAIAEEDLFFDPGSKDMMAGISATKEKLNERHVVSQLPTIYFSPKLARTLYEFTHYVYDIERNEPKDKDDDMMENLRRLILNGLDYIEPPSANEWLGKQKPFVIHGGVDLLMSSPVNLRR
jgi:hypothetical protein